MTPIAPLPQNLDLHEGEEFDLKAVAKNGVLVVTRIMRPFQKAEPKGDAQAQRIAAFERFSKAVQPDHALTDEEMKAGRLESLLRKHVK